MSTTSTDELWGRWRGAEAALAKDSSAAGLEAAAAQLPERLGWYFRAVAQTVAGDGDALEALAHSAPCLAASALADLGNEEPGLRTATSFRALLKRSYVDNEPFPMLDLMRLYMAAKNGEKTTRPKKVVEAAADRPVLDAALTALTGTLAHLDRRDDLEKRSQHAALAWRAAVLRRNGEVQVAAQLAEEFRDTGAETQQWQDRDWLDLDVGMQPAKRRTSPRRRLCGKALLEEFLCAPATAEFQQEHIDAALDVRNKFPQPEVDELAGRLLEAIYVALRAGRLDSGRTAGMATVLMWRVRLLRSTGEILRSQLLRLVSTLHILLKSPDTEGVRHLWMLTGGLPIDQRISIATKLAGNLDDEWVSAHGITSLLAHALLGGESTSRKRAWIEEFGEVMSFAQCTAALTKVGKAWLADGGAPATLALWRGWLFAELGPPAGALHECEQLLDIDGTQEMTEPLLACLTATLRREGRDRQFKRQLARTLDSLAKRLGANGQPDLRLVYFSNLVASKASSNVIPKTTVSALNKIAVANASQLDADGGCQLHQRMRLAMLLGNGALAAEAIQGLGRWLRKAEQKEGLTAALTIAAECVLYEEPNTGWFSEDPIAGLRGDSFPLEDWRNALTRFIDRFPTEIVGRVALDLHRSGGVTGESLLTWFDAHSELDAAQSWSTLKMELSDFGMGDSLDGLLSQMIPGDVEFILDTMMGPN